MKYGGGHNHIYLKEEDLYLRIQGLDLNPIDGSPSKKDLAQFKE